MCCKHFENEAKFAEKSRNTNQLLSCRKKENKFTSPINMHAGMMTFWQYNFWNKFSMHNTIGLDVIWN